PEAAGAGGLVDAEVRAPPDDPATHGVGGEPGRTHEEGDHGLLDTAPGAPTCRPQVAPAQVTGAGVDHPAIGTGRDEQQVDALGREAGAPQVEIDLDPLVGHEERRGLCAAPVAAGRGQCGNWSGSGRRHARTFSCGYDTTGPVVVSVLGE